MPEREPSPKSRRRAGGEKRHGTEIPDSQRNKDRAMSAQGGATGSVHVNVFGGPGSGKSTMAYAVAAELKARGYTAECVGEVVKDCIYDAARGDQEAARLLDGSVESQEELYRRQSARERRLDGLVQFVVADSPAIMGLAYLAPRRRRGQGGEAGGPRAGRVRGTGVGQRDRRQGGGVRPPRPDTRRGRGREDRRGRPGPCREGHGGAVRDGGPRRRGQGCGDGRRARLGREDRR